MSASTDYATVGSGITLSCSSDLYPVRLEWYKDNSLLSRTSTTSEDVAIEVISTDDEGAVYTCNAIGSHKLQKRNMTLSVQGKKMLLQLWGPGGIRILMMSYVICHVSSARQLDHN